MTQLTILALTLLFQPAAEASESTRYRCTASYRLDFAVKRFSAVGKNRAMAEIRALNQCRAARVDSPLASQCEVTSCFPMR